jgi:protein TonB
MAFEAFLYQEKRKPKKGRRITYTLSLILHGALLFVGAIYSFWHVDELTPPSVSVTFMAGTPPPPPPPPARRKSQTKVKPKTPTQIVQPKPNDIIQPKQEEKEVEQDDGVEGGVEGGVAGGVVGGIVGAPVSKDPPKMVPPAIGKGQLAIDPTVPPYAVKLPAALARAGMTLFAMVKICVSPDGTVKDTKLIKSADPTLDPEIMGKIQSTWRYKPYTVDGRPVPFCYVLRYEIAAR